MSVNSPFLHSPFLLYGTFQFIILQNGPLEPHSIPPIAPDSSHVRLVAGHLGDSVDEAEAGHAGTGSRSPQEKRVNRRSQGGRFSAALQGGECFLGEKPIFFL